MKKIIYLLKLLYCVVIGTPMFLGLAGIIVTPIVVITAAIINNQELLLQSSKWMIISVVAYLVLGFLLPDELPERPE